VTPRLLAAGLATVLATGFAAVGLVPTAATAGTLHSSFAAQRTTGSTHARATRARNALDDAKALFARHRAGVAHPVQGRDATMVLRDLARRAEDLPTVTLRRQARAVLARPTDGTGPSDDGISAPDYGTETTYRHCGAHVCVHWVESGEHRTDPTDADGNGYPDQVDRTLSVMENVYVVEVTGMGYRAPLSDAAAAENGGSDQLDVYLADIGPQWLYGYCTSDDPDLGSVPSTYAYCVLDNDYSPDQFGTRHTPEQNLKVTAAHEFFHAVQYAYSWNRADWLMEGTAAWMEDEVYDDVNDNRQYLVESPLTYPNVPLTSFDYGAWIFWRFLSEWSRPGPADDATVVRGVWNRAATVSSMGALRETLASRGFSVAAAFRAFGTWTRSPRHFFSEGGAYPAASTGKAFVLSAAHPGTGAWAPRLDHMSHAFIRFQPGTSLRGDWRLQVRVNMADTARGSVVGVVVIRPDGSVHVHPFRLDRHGNATHRYPFRRATVGHLDLDLGNAGTSSRDNGEAATFSARAVR